MTGGYRKRRLGRVLTAVFVPLLSTLGGIVLGGFYVRFFVPRTGMGWDALADMLGGVMVGGLIGLSAGVVLAFMLWRRLGVGG